MRGLERHEDIRVAFLPNSVKCHMVLSEPPGLVFRLIVHKITAVFFLYLTSYNIGVMHLCYLGIVNVL